MTLIFVDRDHGLRPVAERKIAAAFRQTYGAKLRSFASLLVVDLGADGEIESLAGLRYGDEPFLSEAYLDLPIESALAPPGTPQIARNCVVEICNLASLRPGRAIPFIRRVTRLCHGCGFEWAVFTATVPLRALLDRGGLALHDLGPALASRVTQPEGWGTYYDHAPRVVAVHKDGIRRFIERSVETHALPEALHA